MKASSHSFSVLLLVHLLIWSITAQEPAPGFSESKAYSPRIFAGRTAKPSQPQDGGKGRSPSPGENKLLEFSVSVIDKSGRFVTGLRRDDFTVFLDDNETEILAFVPGGDPVNLILLIDSRPSLIFGGPNIQKFTRRLVNRIPPQKKIMIIQYGLEMRIMTPMTNDRAVISKAINKLNFFGAIPLYETIGDLFVKQLPDLIGREAVIMITDGMNAVTWNYDYEHSLLEVERGDAMIFPIYYDKADRVEFGNKKPKKAGWIRSSAGGIMMIKDLPGIKEGDYELGRWYLNDLVDISGGRILSVITSEKPPDPAPIDGLMRELALRYLVRVALPKNSVPGMRHSIRVRVNRPDVRVISRGSYLREK